MHHRVSRQLCLRLGVAAMAAVSLVGCGLFESAGEVVVGEGQIPEMILDFQLPSLAQFRDQQTAATDATKRVLSGALEKTSSLAHLAGVVALGGQCDVRFTTPGHADLGAASDLVTRLITCPASGACSHLCGDHRGVLLEFDVDLLVANATVTREINAQFAHRVDNTLVGARLRFNEVVPYVMVEGKRTSLMRHVHKVSAIVTDVGGNSLKVLDAVHMELIAQGQRPRVTFDADSPFTVAMIHRIEANEAVTFRLQAHLLVTAGDAYQWPVYNSGFRLRAQPELVFSVLGSMTP